MDSSRFSNALKTGEILPIATPDGPDIAFVPESLPPRVKLNDELWRLFGEAKEQLGRLDGTARTLPNPQLLLRPLQANESLTSSRLEGTFATTEELMLFELDPSESKKESDQANAVREVHNYSRALAEGYRELENLPFCLRLIKKLHATLLEDVRGGFKNPGEFREHQVHIGSNKRYIAPPPSYVMRCLDALEGYINDPQDDLPPLIRCFIVHYQLEAIHPFCDGNGRIGRVVLSLMIYKWCGLLMPWLYLSPYFERYKDEYIENLFRVSTDGAWEKWIEFCLRGVVTQARDAINKCDGLRSLRETMRGRVTDGNGRVPAIIDQLFNWPVLRVADVRQWHSISTPTAKSDILYLAEKDILCEMASTGARRAKTYFCREIIQIAYKEQEF